MCLRFEEAEKLRVAAVVLLLVSGLAVGSPHPAETGWTEGMYWRYRISMQEFGVTTASSYKFPLTIVVIQTSGLMVPGLPDPIVMVFLLVEAERPEATLLELPVIAVAKEERLWWPLPAFFIPGAERGYGVRLATMFGLQGESEVRYQWLQPFEGPGLLSGTLAISELRIRRVEREGITVAETSLPAQAIEYSVGTTTRTREERGWAWWDPSVSGWALAEGEIRYHDRMVLQRYRIELVGWGTWTPEELAAWRDKVRDARTWDLRP